MANFELALARTPEEIEIVRALVAEYNATLDHAVRLRHIEDELRTLPGAYAPPKGRFYLALVGAGREAAGCGALRPFGAGEDCELKRMYVKPAFRGMQIGRALAERLIAEARGIGYRRMLLDTIPPMEAALALYRSLGFAEIDGYFDNPIPDAIHMALKL